MRNYERDTENRLARNGFNISPVLLRASQRVKELVRDPTTDGWTIAKADRKPIGDRILRNIAQFPDEPFDSFDFIITKANDVMFGFKTPHSSEPVTARILSDGTLRALAILTALETSVAGQHLILEEFDNGVHPSRVAVLTEALFDCAWRNNLHVLATTQNPATMNALTKEQLSSVLLVVHQADVKSARLLPLKELPGYIEFVEQGRLGDLITRRIYEQHLGDDYEGQRHQDMESWLKALP